MDVSSVTDTAAAAAAAAAQAAATTDTTTPTTTDTSTTPAAGATGGAPSFRALLEKEIGKSSGTQVNEEELFSALIGQRLTKENADAGSFYNTEKTKLSSSMAKSNGYIPVEEVSCVALRNTVAAGKLDQATAEKIKGEAFTAAQLDDNKDALYDSIGGNGDTTIAQMDFDAAMTAADAVMSKIESGELTAESRGLDLGATGSNGGGGGGSSSAGSGAVAGGANGDGAGIVGEQAAPDGPNGFLWKPVSDSTGKLAVLLPGALHGLISRLEIHSSLPPDDATKIGEGHDSPNHDDARPIYRFDKPGADYGDNVYVVAYKTDGTTASWKINDGGSRVD